MRPEFESRMAHCFLLLFASMSSEEDVGSDQSYDPTQPLYDVSLDCHGDDGIE